MMVSLEGISVYLETLNSNQNSLRKAILMLANVWSDLDKHLDNTKEGFSRCVTDLESQRKKLEADRDSIVEHNRQLNEAQLSFKAWLREVFEMKEKQLAEIRMRAEEKMKEDESKTARLTEQMESNKLLLREEKKEFESIKTDIGKKLNEIALKEKQIDDRSKELQLIQNCIERQVKIVHSKEEQIKIREKQLENELNIKTKRLKEEHKLFEEHRKEFKSKEKQLEERSKHFDLLDKQFEERSKDLMLKETQLDERSKSYNLLDKQFEERAKDLMLKETQLQERSKVFDLLDNQFEERSKNVVLREAQTDDRSKGFELKDKPKRSASGSKSIGLSPFFAHMDGFNLLLFLSKHVESHGLMINEVSVALGTLPDPGKLVLEATEQFLSRIFMEVQCDIDMDALRSCLVLFDILMSHKHVISSQVREASRSLAVDWKVNAGMREENSLLTLGYLRFISAFGLTSDLGPPEIFILAKHTHTIQSNYTLGCSKNWPAPNAPSVEKEINQFQQCGEVPEYIWRTTDPAKLVLDAIEGCYYSKLGSRNITKLEILKGLKFFLSQLLKGSVEVTAQVKEQATKIAADWKDKVRFQGFSEIWCFLLFLATYKVTCSCSNNELLDLLEVVFAVRKTSKDAFDLLCSLGLEDEVPHFIEILVERGKHLDAIKYVRTFELDDKFPPPTLLEDYISYEKAAAEKIRQEGNYSVKSKANAAKKELRALEAVVSCSEQHKLEARYPLKKVKLQIEQRKKQKLAMGSFTSSFVSNAHPEERKRKLIKKRKGFSPEHPNKGQCHPLRAGNLTPHSAYPLQSPPLLIPQSGFYHFGYFPNYYARPDPMSGMHSGPPARNQRHQH